MSAAPAASARAAAPVLDFAAFRGRLPANDAPPAIWSFPTVAARLVELVGHGASASLTLAARLVLDAQARQEPTAWITSTARSVYPPDLAAAGVDLEALVIVQVEGASAMARAAEQLGRSGAFGLVVIDCAPSQGTVPPALMSRLLGLAQKHHMAFVFLTEKSGGPRAGALLSQRSLISLRAETRLTDRGRGAFSASLHVVKDKRRAPHGTHEEVCRGPAGMR